MIPFLYENVETQMHAMRDTQKINRCKDAS